MAAAADGCEWAIAGWRTRPKALSPLSDTGSFVTDAVLTVHGRWTAGSP